MVVWAPGCSLPTASAWPRALWFYPRACLPPTPPPSPAPPGRLPAPRASDLPDSSPTPLGLRSIPAPTTVSSCLSPPSSRPCPGRPAWAVWSIARSLPVFTHTLRIWDPVFSCVVVGRVDCACRLEARGDWPPQVSRGPRCTGHRLWHFQSLHLLRRPGGVSYSFLSLEPLPSGPASVKPTCSLLHTQPAAESLPEPLGTLLLR